MAPERRDRLKWVDPIALRDLVERTELVDVSRFEHALEIDVTALPARDAAQVIADHLEAITTALKAGEV